MARCPQNFLLKLQFKLCLKFNDKKWQIIQTHYAYRMFRIGLMDTKLINYYIAQAMEIPESPLPIHVKYKL